MKFQYSLLLIAVSVWGLSACNDHAEAQDHAIPPVIEEITPNSIELTQIGRTESRGFAVSAAEIPAYDAETKRLFVVNAKQGVVDIFDMTDPKTPKLIGSLDAKAYLSHSEVNSVAVYKGIVALAVQAENKTDLGIVALFHAKDSRFISQVAVGALPDMLTFTADGKTLLVANEAEPSDDYQIDPEGSISVIDLSNINAPIVRTADFKAFNGQERALTEQGIRIFGPKASAAQDFEPEYISVSNNGKLAWVTLQENNALAKVDVVNAKVLAIYPFGFKDHGLSTQGLDVSDVDAINAQNKPAGQPSIQIKPWPNVRGLYMPDAISSFEVNAKTYLVTANEGDARVWFKGQEKNNPYWSQQLNAGFVEEWRVKHLLQKDGFDRRKGEDLPAHLAALAQGAELNPINFAYCGAVEGDAKTCREDHVLGRLNITWTDGYQKNVDGTPKLNQRGHLVYDHLYSFGTRSFSIWTENATQTGLELVWDSADQFEQQLAQNHPEIFNANHEEAGIDNRSDNKGPEPEGVVLAKLGQKTFAFIGLERVGGVMVYDVSTPKSPKFVQYINSRDVKANTAQIQAGQAGDLGPEGLAFISAKDSPNAQPLLVVGNEVSGTTAVYQIKLK